MGEPVERSDLRELLAVGAAVARQAGALARARRLAGVGEVATKSTTTDLVTPADRAVERLIAQLLREHRPADTVIGEEFGGAPAPSGVSWVVDPIDGTVNYVYGIPVYAVSVAAQVDGVSVVGVVRNPVSGEEWTAVRGAGAWRDGRRLHCSRVSELGQTLVATGFGYDAARRAHQAHVIEALLPRIRDIRRLGAASLDLCFTAEGRVDAFFEKGLNAWDHAAGGLIAAESGVRVGGLRGAAPGPEMVLAAPAALFDPLHDLLVGLDADGGP